MYLDSTASAVLGKCNALWTWILDQRVTGHVALDGARGTPQSVGTPENSLRLTLPFFQRALRDVNAIPGLGPRWSRGKVDAAAGQAVGFFERNQVRAIVCSLVEWIFYGRGELYCFSPTPPSSPRVRSLIHQGNAAVVTILRCNVRGQGVRRDREPTPD